MQRFYLFNTAALKIRFQLMNWGGEPTFRTQQMVPGLVNSPDWSLFIKDKRNVSHNFKVKRTSERWSEATAMSLLKLQNQQHVILPKGTRWPIWGKNHPSLVPFPKHPGGLHDHTGPKATAWMSRNTGQPTVLRLSSKVCVLFKWLLSQDPNFKVIKNQ